MNPVVHCEFYLKGETFLLECGPDEVVSRWPLFLFVRQVPTDKGQRYSVLLESKSEVKIRRLEMRFQQDYEPKDMLLENGFQSWSETKEYGIKEVILPLAKQFWSYTNHSGDYSFVPYSATPGHIHSHLFTRIRGEKHRNIHYASLDESEGYSIIHHFPDQDLLTIEKDCAGQVISGEWTAMDIIRFEGSDKDFKSLWKNYLAVENIETKKHIGYTSWYYHYTHINQKIIRKNLDEFKKRPELKADIFQIDDGWQMAVGDWMWENKKFSDGLGMLANEILKAGMTPGLWWAPFICEQDSHVFREHPEWLVTFDGDHPVAGGFNPGWSGPLKGKYFILDIYHEGVRNYLRQGAEKIVKEWGFGLVKCDFLFAAAYWPRNGKNRGQIMHDAMVFLREILKSAWILGCGVPLGSAMGLVDFCRIGPDVGLDWDMEALAKLNLRERISTKNAIRNTIHRYVMDGVGFRNDPDVFILREKKNRLTGAEKRMLLLTNCALGGIVLTSDDVSEWDEYTLRALEHSWIVNDEVEIEYRVDDHYILTWGENSKTDVWLH